MYLHVCFIIGLNTVLVTVKRQLAMTAVQLNSCIAIDILAKCIATVCRLSAVDHGVLSSVIVVTLRPHVI